MRNAENFYNCMLHKIANFDLIMQIRYMQMRWISTKCIKSPSIPFYLSFDVSHTYMYLIFYLYHDAFVFLASLQNIWRPSWIYANYDRLPGPEN